MNSEIRFKDAIFSHLEKFWHKRYRNYPHSNFTIMYKSINSDSLIIEISNINRSDRWSIYRRLQELKISCWCPQDGTLWVEANYCLDAILIRSTIQQFVESRSELTDWLERCWTSPILSTDAEKVNMI